MSYEIYINFEEGGRESASFDGNGIQKILEKIQDDSSKLFPDLSSDCKTGLEMGYFWIDSEYSAKELSLILNSIKSVRETHLIHRDCNNDHIVVQEMNHEKEAQRLTVGDLQRAFLLSLNHLISVLEKRLS